MSLYNSSLKPLTAGTWTHSYQHATKLFLSDNFKLAPKQSFLYYVKLNINQSLLASLVSGSNVSSQTAIQQIEAGMLVKQVTLPKFKINTKTYNAYNRKNIVQSRIEYEPAELTFHDDSADTVTTFWNDYYTYYYRDSDLDTSNFNAPYSAFKNPEVFGVYGERGTTNWGYGSSSNESFFTSIQIFSLHNKRFTEYELINPYITSWAHGQHNSAENTNLLENRMTIEFETVKYKTGYVNPIHVGGFATMHYDNVQSPISTSKTNLNAENGIIGVLSGAPKDLARPNGVTQSDLIGSVNNAINLIKTVSGANLSNLSTTALASFGISQVSKAVNSTFNSPVTVPTLSNLVGATASSLTNEVKGAVSAVTGAVNSAVSAVNSAVGAVNSAVTGAVGAVNSAITGAVTDAGLNFSNQISSGSYDEVGLSYSPPSNDWSDLYG